MIFKLQILFAMLRPWYNTLIIHLEQFSAHFVLPLCCSDSDEFIAKFKDDRRECNLIRDTDATKV